jgi:hypothetical protein
LRFGCWSEPDPVISTTTSKERAWQVLLAGGDFGVVADFTRAIAPERLRNFMFTDIEGSTRLHRQLGDRFAALIAEHDGLLARGQALVTQTVVAAEGVLGPMAADPELRIQLRPRICRQGNH